MPGMSGKDLRHFIQGTSKNLQIRSGVRGEVEKAD